MASPASETVGRHRYGIVLALAIVEVVFLIVAAEGAGSRAIGLVLAAGMLIVVVMTSRSERTVRETAAGGIGLVTLVVALLVALQAAPKWIASALSIVVVLVTLGQLVRGLVRLLRTRGVTVQAVAGALAVYLLVGIVFSFVVGTMAKLGSGPYFAQGFDGSESQRVYFSFTSMTTTGFGDLTPATRGGRAVAVLEMLTGQIYLVTVISLLVGNLRRERADETDAA
jgi:hypothetical protein